MKAVAFIPARGGSKGIPGKNKKLFCGKPLVQWSIEQAKESKLFDKIIVSSDDPDILKLARDMGVEADERPAELAQDETTLDSVVVEYFQRQDEPCDYICLMQPTSPLRTVKDLRESFRFIKLKKYVSVVGVQQNPIIGWVGKMLRRGGEKDPRPGALYLIHKRPNRQDRDDWYLENGAIFWTKYSVFMTTRNRIGNPLQTYLYVMPHERSIDLDSPFDWVIAEKAYEWGQANG